MWFIKCFFFDYVKTYLIWVSSHFQSTNEKWFFREKIVRVWMEESLRKSGFFTCPFFRAKDAWASCPLKIKRSTNAHNASILRLSPYSLSSRALLLLGFGVFSTYYIGGVFYYKNLPNSLQCNGNVLNLGKNGHWPLNNWFEVIFVLKFFTWSVIIFPFWNGLGVYFEKDTLKKF